jgi:transposase
MSDLYWMTDEQMARLLPFFSNSHGKPRVDDRRVLSGIVFVYRSGCAGVMSRRTVARTSLSRAQSRGPLYNR